MSDLKPKNIPIKLGAKEYGMRFTLNTIDEIQDHFGIAITALGDILQDKKKSIKNIKFVLMTLINEGIDCHADETGEQLPHVDEAYVGRNIDVSNIGEITTAIYSALSAGAPRKADTAEDEDAELPNS